MAVREASGPSSLHGASGPVPSVQRVRDQLSASPKGKMLGKLIPIPTEPGCAQHSQTSLQTPEFSLGFHLHSCESSSLWHVTLSYRQESLGSGPTAAGLPLRAGTVRSQC